LRVVGLVSAGGLRFLADLCADQSFIHAVRETFFGDFEEAVFALDVGHRLVVFERGYYRQSIVAFLDDGAILDFLRVAWRSRKRSIASATCSSVTSTVDSETLRPS